MAKLIDGSVLLQEWIKKPLGALHKTTDVLASISAQPEIVLDTSKDRPMGHWEFSYYTNQDGQNRMRFSCPYCHDYHDFPANPECVISDSFVYCNLCGAKLGGHHDGKFA